MEEYLGQVSRSKSKVKVIRSQSVYGAHLSLKDVKAARKKQQSVFLVEEDEEMPVRKSKTLLDAIY